MAASAHSVTPTSGTVVELIDARKAYRQRQRTGGFGDALRGLVRPRYREIRALDGVSLRVRRGEIVAYAGPNGAGKSTTIKLLSGLLHADAGSVRVLGLDPARDRVRVVSRAGVVFGHRTELWWDHPVGASFDWKRAVWSVPRATYDEMVAFVRDRLSLDELWEVSARELSLGQRMRADLGLALVHGPDILLLDEPTIGLDVLAKRAILSFVKDLARERSVTVVVTSHDMDELEQLAGRIVLIDRGAIAFDGDFDELRRGFGIKRRLAIETANGDAPSLSGAELVSSEAGRHEYVFDPTVVAVPRLLEQAAAQTTVLDIETHRPPIDDVIASIYESWTGGR